MRSERSQPRRIGALWLAVLVGVGFAALGLAWAGANPPGASPDEPANLVKAYATGDGQISGAKQGPAPGSSFDNDRVKSWFDLADRTYRIPATLDVPAGQVPCFAFLRDESASCITTQKAATRADASTTQFGTYPPFLFAPSGVAMQRATSFSSADLRGRIADVLLCAALIGWATYLIVDERRRLLTLGGLLLGISPMVVFLSASVTTNGIEAAAAACAWAALLRLTRDDPQGSNRSAWWGLAVGGGVMALSRMLDPFFLAVAIGVALLLRSRRGTPSDRPRPSRAPVPKGPVAVLGVAVAVHPTLDLSASAHALRPAITHLPNQLRQVIGIFGWNETTMPQPAYGLWLLLTGLLVLGALCWGRRAERLAVIGLGLAVLVADVAIATLVEAPIGFGMQARYILPLTVAVPMIGAEVLNRHRSQLGGRRARQLGAAAAGGAIALQATAFLVNSHRYAVGASGTWSLPWPSHWAPSGGLLPWLVVAAVGVAALVVATVAAWDDDDQSLPPGNPDAHDAAIDGRSDPDVATADPEVEAALP
jgi:hypothetical protein